MLDTQALGSPVGRVGGRVSCQIASVHLVQRIVVDRQPEASARVLETHRTPSAVAHAQFGLLTIQGVKSEFGEVLVAERVDHAQMVVDDFDGEEIVGATRLLLLLGVETSLVENVGVRFDGGERELEREAEAGRA